MTPEQITTVVTGVLQGGGLVTFVWLLLKGIRGQLDALKSTAEIQEKAISTMEKRIAETERIGDIYKNLVSDLPATMDNYKAIVTRTTDEMSIRLEQTTKEREEIALRLSAAQDELQSMKETGEEKRRRELQTTIFLYQEQNKDLAKFLSSLSDDQERLIQLLAESTSFDDFLQQSDIQAVTNTDPDLARKVFASKDDEEMALQLRQLKSANLGMHGLYVITNDKKIIVDEERIAAFRKDIDRLKNWLLKA